MPNPTTSLQLSPEQASAVDAAREWYLNSSEQTFRLFGYAGTGKTTIAKYLVEAIQKDQPLSHYFGAFTGKAAHVLRTKGTPAQTIHSLAYCIKNPKAKKPEFILNDESILYNTDLLIVDEVSMVGEEMGRDLESFGCKILVLGDPMQLPPIKGAGYFTDCEPDFLLTKIHRQAEGNPIIKLASMVREGKMPLAGKYGDSEVGFGMPKTLVMAADQLIVGKNVTRFECNERARSILGYANPLPVKGDKLVCLRNNHRAGLMNGTIWIVEAADTEYEETDEEPFLPGAYVCDLRAEDTGDLLSGVQMHREIFLGQELDYKKARRANEFDFGYALTCHKSQGSQWPHVVVLDESNSFRESKWRWLYTAITRAAEKVNICKR